MNKKFKLQTLWEMIDDITDIDIKEMSKVRRNKYFALKSLLLKESEYLRSLSKIPDFTESMLTEDITYNKKILKEDINRRLRKWSNLDENFALVISEGVKDNTINTKAKLEALVLADIIDSYIKTKKVPSNLGFDVSSQLVEGYIDSLVEFINS